MSSGFFLLVFVLTILVAVSLRFYLPLARLVLVQQQGRVGSWWVGRIDALVAIVLVAWFAMMGRAALMDEGSKVVEFHHVVTGSVVYASVVLFLGGILIYRNYPLSRVFGWDAGSFAQALGQGLLYLAAAYPLLLLVQAMVYGGLGMDEQPQEVVQFLRDAVSSRDRIAILVMAIVIAPVAEETIFRGYLYPVAKRYLGSFVALAGTSLLFAILHGHLSSIPALFTLAMCLGLAYEKSGSLLVPMIMHAVFNAVSAGAIIFLL